MGTHPIFESDFDCLTEIDLKSIENGQVEEHFASQPEQEGSPKWNSSTTKERLQADVSQGCRSKVRAKHAIRQEGKQASLKGINLSFFETECLSVYSGT